MNIVKTAYEAVKSWYHREPARVVALAVAAVVALAQLLDLGVDQGTVFIVVGTVLAVVFGGEVTRRKVTPVKK